MNLHDITLRLVAPDEEPRFKALLEAHHYLGAAAKIGHALWYVATWRGHWLALLVLSAAAWKCAARDDWIGWDRRYPFDRLHLIANNARFLNPAPVACAESRFAGIGIVRAPGLCASLDRTRPGAPGPSKT